MDFIRSGSAMPQHGKEATGLCTAFNMFAVVGLLFLGTHFVIGAFIYFPDFMLLSLGRSPERGALIPRCESLHWADPGYYKVEGDLSLHQQQVFVESNQTGGVFLDYTCYDALCGLALAPQTAEEPQTRLMLPVAGRNITALAQLPESCREVIGGAMPVGAAMGECSVFCAQIIGSGLRSAVAPVCAVSAGGSELGEVYGLCARMAASSFFGGVSVLSSSLAGALVFALAWAWEAQRGTGYQRIADNSDGAASQLGVPREKRLQGLLAFAAGAIMEPSFAVAGLVSYCQAGQLLGIFGILASIAGIADPFQLRAAHAVRDSWRCGSATRELYAHAVTVGKVGGSAAAMLATFSILVTPAVQLGWSTVILRLLTIVCSCGVSMPNAVVAELAFEAHDLGLLDMDDDPNLGRFAKQVGPAKYSLSLVAVAAATALAAASGVDAPLRSALLLPLAVLVAMAIPQIGEAPVTVRHWLSCPYSIVALLFLCLLPILAKSAVVARAFEAAASGQPCTVLQALLFLTGMLAAAACPCL